MELAGRLRTAMQDKGLIPASLARAARTTEATVSNWLNGRIETEHVKAALLFRMADAAAVDVRELFTGKTAGQSGSEGTAEYASHPLKQTVLTIAVRLISEALEGSDLALPPDKFAEAVTLAYDLLEEGLPDAKVLRFVHAAVGK